MRLPCPRPTILFAASALFASVTACSTSDTILALTIKSGADIGAVDKIQVKVTSTSGATFSDSFAPPTTDGAIQASFYQRLTLSSVSGPATITAEAQRGGVTFAAGLTSVTIVKDGATAAAITLMLGGLPPPDAGTDAGSDGGGGDATDGAAADVANAADATADGPDAATGG